MENRDHKRFNFSNNPFDRFKNANCNIEDSIINSVLIISNYTPEESEFLDLFYPNFEISKNLKWSWIESEEDIINYFIYLLFPYFYINPRLSQDEFRKLGFNNFLDKVYSLDNSFTFSFFKTKSKTTSFKTLENFAGKEKANSRIQYVKERLGNLNLTNKVYKKPLSLIHISKGKITDFPLDLRNILIKFIFDTLIKNKDLSKEKIFEFLISSINSDTIWLNRDVCKEELDFLKLRLNDDKYKVLLNNYFKDLIVILYNLYFTNLENQEQSTEQIFVIEDFVSSLPKENSFKSHFLIAQIFDFLKFEYPTFFKLNRLLKTKLFTNETLKECGQCHNIKLLEHFEKFSGGKRTRSICKDCRVDVRITNDLKKKVKLIQNIYGGIYDAKCPYCVADLLIILPATHFHHSDENLKSTNYYKISSRSYENILKILEKEKTIPCCSNCHEFLKSDILKNHREIIF